MKYKLLKDTPTIKAGTIFEKVVRGVDGIKGSAVVVSIGANTDFQWTIKDIDNFDEWFEEIEEPLDSIHWEPDFGEEYWYVNYIGDVVCRVWEDAGVDFWLLESGNIYRTKEECEKAHERKLAEVRLRRTSNFKPDLEKCKGGWVVDYDYCAGIFSCTHIYSTSRGEPVYYATKEEAEKSIRENEQDWKIYFGIKEEE